MPEIKSYISKASKALPFVAIIILLFMLSACTVVHNFETSPSLETRRAEYKTIGVMPFTGNAPDIVPMSEWFAFNLNKQNQFNVIDPALVEILAKDNGLTIHLDSESQDQATLVSQTREISFFVPVGSSRTITTESFSTEYLQRIGIAIGADAIATSSANREDANVFIETRLVDVVSGEIMASVQATVIIQSRNYHQDMAWPLEDMAMKILSAILSSDSQETGGR